MNMPSRKESIITSHMKIILRKNRLITRKSLRIRKAQKQPQIIIQKSRKIIIIKEILKTSIQRSKMMAIKRISRKTILVNFISSTIKKLLDQTNLM